ncbi:MAG: CoA ester lyase [Acidimicrobiaceae bacterium]|mgnify:FL=1|jgi:citrate lyase subunit beta/citryl-CoA lyase|nr:CoA ester lyase [Acidimicrobiaceae bacterium]MCH2633291.1 CoA ester lyase [Acidimicrobiales bacterium]HCK74039.1 CoA ester lyase [Acidimicrobiaceae bacterium]|tara:strand:+ start:4951 stop:5841 length:891 start_codon:yes stop_codon:yes gene_type:complete
MTIRRAAHFVPGANEKMLMKSLDTAADALILDLEDAVTPENKDSARVTVASWLREVDFGRQERVVRVNPLDSPWFTKDIEETMVTPPDSYLIPKVNNASEIAQIADLVSEQERLHGHVAGAVQLLILGTETPQGFLNIGELAAHPRVDALTWGAEDLSAAIGSRANRNAGGSYLPVFEHARVMCLVAATAWDKQPLDTVFVDFNDPEGLRAECLESATMGYTGKITIHPSQIDVVNEAFTPSSDEVEEARELLALFEEKQAEGLMAFSFKGQMVDVPHLTRARKIVEMAENLSDLE